MRESMAKKKWYAVQKGRRPGLYTSWAETEKQVKGFAGARFKGFEKQSEAEAWLQGDESPLAVRGDSRGGLQDKGEGDSQYSNKGFQIERLSISIPMEEL